MSTKLSKRKKQFTGTKIPLEIFLKSTCFKGKSSKIKGSKFRVKNKEMSNLKDKIAKSSQSKNCIFPVTRGYFKRNTILHSQ